MDIPALRTETPGTQYVTHLNNAGASLMPSPVSEAVTSYINRESLYGGYETADHFSQPLQQIYSDIADFINADSPEIALQENATMAWNMAFHAINFQTGDRILTSASEYASNFINYLKLKDEVEVSIEIIPTDSSGAASPSAVRKMMDERVKLISITHIPTNSGLVNPVEAIGEIATDYPALYLVDACQSVGQYPVNVEKIGCDMLSATGRKYLRGPRGTGFLYVAKEVLDELMPPFLDLHAAQWTASNEFEMREDARRFENWETNYAGIMGLKEAVNYAHAIGIDQIWQRITDLGRILRQKLTNIPTVTVQDIGSTKGGIVTFTVDNTSAEEVKMALADRNINVSISSKASTRLDMEHRKLDQVIRASVHYYNTVEELDKLMDAINSFKA